MNITMNTQSTYELTHQELDRVNGGSLSFGGIIGAGFDGAAGAVGANAPGSMQSGNWASTGYAAASGFIFGAVREFIKEMRT
jgi:hypothetical protein